MAADGSTFPRKLSFAEDLAALDAILKASPGYGKRSSINIAPEVEEGAEDCEPAADELFRENSTWSV